MSVKFRKKTIKGKTGKFIRNICLMLAILVATGIAIPFSMPHEAKASALATPTPEFRFITKWSFGQWQMDNPRGITADKDGYIYVADNDNNCIEKFDSNGTYITQFGGFGSGYGMLNEPRDVAVDNDGYVYVIDMQNNCVQKFDSNGAFVKQWGSEGSGNGEFWGAWAIAVDKDGYVYVADTNNNRVQKFDSDGGYICQWGSSGSGEGQFRYPGDIATDKDGYVYVTDLDNYRIQKFDSSGSYLTQWGSYGYGDSEFNGMMSVTADKDGNIYVADPFNNNMKKFDSNGNFIGKWGSWGYGDGEFVDAEGITTDKDGYIYVADTYNNRIQKFSCEVPGVTVPAISGVTPTDSSKVNLARPTISASYYETGSGIDATSVKVTLDGADKTGLCAITDSSFTYTPSSALSTGIHTVKIELKDNAGNLTTKTWTFTVTKPILTTTKTKAYWAPVLDAKTATEAYTKGYLSVDYQIKNTGTGVANNVKVQNIKATTSTGAITVLSPQPIAVGSIASGESKTTTIIFKLPPNTSKYSTSFTVTCEDDEGATW